MGRVGMGFWEGKGRYGWEYGKGMDR